MPSRFDKDTIREFFEWAAREGKKRIGNINALTDHAYKTGNNDEEIREWLFPPEALMTCPTCKGKGQVPLVEREPEKCFECKGEKHLVRFNPKTDADEVWPCPVCCKDEFKQVERERGAVVAPLVKLGPRVRAGIFAGLEIVTGADGDADVATGEGQANLPG